MRALAIFLLLGLGCSGDRAEPPAPRPAAQPFRVTIRNRTAGPLFLRNPVPFRLGRAGIDINTWARRCFCEACSTDDHCSPISEPDPSALELPAGQEAQVEVDLNWFSDEKIDPASCPDARVGYCYRAQSFESGDYELTVIWATEQDLAPGVLFASDQTLFGLRVWRSHTLSTWEPARRTPVPLTIEASVPSATVVEIE